MFDLLKAFLFNFDPEYIHQLTINLCERAGKYDILRTLLEKKFSLEDPTLNVRLGNLVFPNPVGLAAGYDKDGIAVNLLAALGFGHIEVGTVTPRAQPGNSPKRLFRLEDDLAIINRMGFNNKGIETLLKNLKKTSINIPLGINIGKNKHTPIEKAYQDYIISLEKAWFLADYFTINISSPNTAQLRELHEKEKLFPFLEKILNTAKKLEKDSGKSRQIWLKISPDLPADSLANLVAISREMKIDALVVSNTSVGRPKLKSIHNKETGGLSGKPIFDLSNSVLSKINKLAKYEIPLVGVGGILSGADALEKISRGAVLVQVFTGLVFQGPSLVKDIKKAILKQKIDKTLLS